MHFRGSRNASLTLEYKLNFVAISRFKILVLEIYRQCYFIVLCGVDVCYKLIDVKFTLKTILKIVL
jgi:hypothetical protein